VHILLLLFVTVTSCISVVTSIYKCVGGVSARYSEDPLFRRPAIQKTCYSDDPRRTRVGWGVVLGEVGRVGAGLPKVLLSSVNSCRNWVESGIKAAETGLVTSHDNVRAYFIPKVYSKSCQQVIGVGLVRNEGSSESRDLESQAMTILLDSSQTMGSGGASWAPPSGVWGGAPAAKAFQCCDMQICSLKCNQIGSLTLKENALFFSYLNLQGQLLFFSLSNQTTAMSYHQYRLRR
jgi:hypothetical protein